MNNLLARKKELLMLEIHDICYIIRNSVLQ